MAENDALDDLNCRHASRLLSLACERPLVAEELKALQAHLNECLMCANFEQQLKFMHQASQVFRTGT